MKFIALMVFLLILTSCMATSQKLVVDPCENSLNSADTERNGQQAKEMIIACLKYDSQDSDELAEYLKVGLFQGDLVAARLSEYEGLALEFAKDWVKCHSDVFFSSKQDLIDVLEMGPEKYYESRLDRSMQAHCTCEEYLSTLKPAYKKFYDNPEYRVCINNK
ncbi:hypothetical protein [Sessilibacter corallicola]|uniref:Lipoprotein n=1 Tax=Sessilibacter corallicola TaxID=2904075 RepID=A0ABQ0AF92_9GAMM